MVRLLFPQFEHECARFYKASYSLVTDLFRMRWIWNLAGIQLLSHIINTHEILSAISVRPERLPGGLGILAIPFPIDWRSKITRLQLIDTIIETFERILVPNLRFIVRILVPNLFEGMVRGPNISWGMIIMDSFSKWSPPGQYLRSQGIWTLMGLVYLGRANRGLLQSYWSVYWLLIPRQKYLWSAKKMQRYGHSSN